MTDWELLQQGLERSRAETDAMQEQRTIEQYGRTTVKLWDAVPRGSDIGCMSPAPHMVKQTAFGNDRSTNLLKNRG